MDIERILREYGYDIKDDMTRIYEDKEVKKIYFNTKNEAPFLIVYFLTGKKKYEINQLYDKYFEEMDLLCSLFWVISKDGQSVYSKNLKTGQYSAIREIVCYNRKQRTNVESEKILSADFENVFLRHIRFLEI